MRTYRQRSGSGIWALVALVAILGCERQSSELPPPPTTQPASAPTTGPAPMPRATYRFAPQVAAQCPPDLTRFIREAMQTMLLGEYADYRGLISRARTPETEERFSVIQEALRSVEVTAIEEVELPNAPPPTYRILTAFEFDPESMAAHKLESRELAILVFKEGDQWRLMIAPPALQPTRAEATTTQSTTQATQPTPDYPWDDDEDY